MMYLYVLVWHDKSRIKIGITNNVPRRARQLGGMGCFDWEMSHACVDKGKKIQGLEKYIHGLYNDKRVNVERKETKMAGNGESEWFEFDILDDVWRSVINYMVEHYESASILPACFSFDKSKIKMSELCINMDYAFWGRQGFEALVERIGAF